MDAHKNGKRRSVTLNRALYVITLGSFILSVIYVSLRAIFDPWYREVTEYKIMIFQSLFGILVVNLPSILERRFMWRIPAGFSAAFTLFLFAAIFLGEAGDFYYRIPIWDDLLHLSSSMMLGLLGFSLIDILNNRKTHTSLSLSPFFVSLFSVTFALLFGVLWEIYEFSFDGILGLNMQKFMEMSEGGALVELAGRAALADTMRDLITDLVGAVLVSIFGYISLKRGKGWLEAFKVEIDGAESADKTDTILKDKQKIKNKGPKKRNKTGRRRHP